MAEAVRSGRRGGRKSEGRQMVGVTVNLDAEDLAALDELGRKMARSRSDLLREAVRRTWLDGLRAQTASAAPKATIRPAATASMTPEEKAAWRERFQALVGRLRENPVTDMSEDELAEFVRAEVKAYRAEKRARPASNG
jgi:predicted transcriptional regulator